MYLYSIKMLKVEKRPEEFERFLILHGPKYKYNSKQLQANSSSVCGQHCLMYSYFKCCGYSFQNYLNLFDDVKASYFYESTM